MFMILQAMPFFSPCNFYKNKGHQNGPEKHLVLSLTFKFCCKSKYILIRRTQQKTDTCFGQNDIK